MFITPSFKKSLIVEQFQGNYLKSLQTENVIFSFVEFLLGQPAVRVAVKIELSHRNDTKIAISFANNKNNENP